MLDGLLDALLRPHCRRCGGAAGRRPVCGGCWAELPWNRTGCETCAMPMPPGAVGRCSTCRGRTPALDGCTAALRYEMPVAGWLRAFKYQRQLEWADCLAETLVLAMPPAPLPDLLLPVPLHPARLRQRGFNQALEIARPLAAGLGRPLAEDLAERLRPTPKQSRQASRAERRRNLAGAFRVVSAVRGRHVAIIDDVITTGATVETLARACRRAGAVRVTARAVARTP